MNSLDKENTIVERFLIPINEEIKLEINGYLPDPKGKYEKYYNPNIKSFTDLENENCYIILGEPAIGKTTALKAEYERICSKGINAFWVDLRNVSSEDSLNDEIFQKINDIESKKLYLFLDALDESLLNYNSFPTRFIKKIEKLNLGNIYLRFACRAKNFSSYFESELKRIYDLQDQNILLKLAPYSRNNVETIAKHFNVDNIDEFFETIDKYRITSFAIKPITLRYIIQKYNERVIGTSLDKISQFKMYYYLCEKLCEEINPYRASLHQNHLTVKQKLYLSARIATDCFVIAKNKNKINLSNLNIDAEDTINLENFSFGLDKIDGQEIFVDKNIIDSIVELPFFEPIDINCIGFNSLNKTYIDFLTSYYLLENIEESSSKVLIIKNFNPWKNIEDKSIYLKDLLNSFLLNKKLIPHFYNIASWMACSNDSLFNELIKENSEYLIISDVLFDKYTHKKKLLDKLFTTLKNNENFSDYWKILNSLYKLNYKDMSKNAAKYLKSKDFNIRYFAINLIRTCKIKECQDNLLELALNNKESLETRYYSLHGLKIFNNNEIKEKIFNNIDNFKKDFDLDKNDELRGAFLSLLWPDYLSAKEMFSLLIPPKNDHFHGMYAGFIYNEIIENLDSNSVLDALSWISSIEQRIWDLPFVFQELMKNIYAKAFTDYSDNEIVLNKFGHTIYERLKKDYWLLENFERKTLYDEEARRQNLIKEIILNILSEEDDFSSFSRVPRIILPKDIPWLVDLYKNENDATKKEKIGNILKYFGKNWQIDEDDEELKQIFNNFNSDDEISNNFGKFIISFSKKENTDEEEKPHPKLLTFINEDLKKIEDTSNEENYLAWSDLTADIKLKEDDKHRSIGDISAYKSLPGWKYSDDNTKKRIINAAKQYVEKNKTDYSSLASEKGWSYNNYLGKDALVLLYGEDKSYVENLTSDLLEQWAPVVVTWAFPSSDLIKLFYEKIPDKIISILSNIIDFQSTQEYPILTILDSFSEFWDQKLTNLLISKLHEFINKLKKEENEENINFKTEIINNLFDSLIKYDEIEANKLLNKLFEIFNTKQHIVDFIVKASLSFIDKASNAGWNIIWAYIKKYNDFGKKLAMEIGFYRNFHTDKPFITKLNPIELADLFIWLEENFPLESDPDLDNTGRVSKRYELRQLKWQIFSYLVSGGYLNEINNIFKKFKKKFAKHDWIKNQLAQAETISTEKKSLSHKPSVSLINKRIDFIRFVTLLGFWLGALGLIAGIIGVVLAIYSIKTSKDSNILNKIKSHQDIIITGNKNLTDKMDKSFSDLKLKINDQGNKINILVKNKFQKEKH